MAYRTAEKPVPVPLRWELVLQGTTGFLRYFREIFTAAGLLAALCFLSWDTLECARTNGVARCEWKHRGLWGASGTMTSGTVRLQTELSLQVPGPDDEQLVSKLTAYLDGNQQVTAVTTEARGRAVVQEYQAFVQGRSSSVSMVVGWNSVWIALGLGAFSLVMFRLLRPFHKDARLRCYEDGFVELVAGVNTPPMRYELSKIDEIQVENIDDTELYKLLFVQKKEPNTVFVGPHEVVEEARKRLNEERRK